MLLDWIKRMQDAIDLIESGMESHLEIGDIAKAAYSSPYHFQRMFYMLTGLTVAEYIRKRKLTLAAQELAMSSAKVLDVALKYGYDSPESFAKAFRKAHGISPSTARNPGTSLKAFPRISFHLSVKGDKDMDYKIIEKDSFTVIGKSIHVSTKDGENTQRIPKFWQECNQDGTSDYLCSLEPNQDMLGICMGIDQATQEFDYFIAVETSSDTTTAEIGYSVREIPASTWAIFTSIGPMPDSIQKVWERIFQEWFPATGYEHAVGPELEVYPLGDTTSADYKCEVWVPIVKK